MENNQILCYTSGLSAYIFVLDERIFEKNEHVLKLS